MKKKKRLLATLATLMLVFSTVSGCGSNSANESQDSTGSQTASTTENSASEERPTVTWCAVGTETDTSDRVSAAATQLLNDAGINVDFEIRWYSWSNYAQQITNMIATGEEFDLFNYDISSINNYAVSGGVYEISDEDLEQYLDDAVSAMTEEIVDKCRYNGSLYAIPVAHEFAQWRGVYYNVGIAEEYGIDMSQVKSIEDLDSAFATLKEKAPDIIPLDSLNSENILLVMADQDDVNRNASLCLGMDVSDENGAVFNIWENEKVINALRKIREWNEAGYILTDTTLDYTSMFQTEGKIFCHIARMKPGTVEQYSTGGQTFDYILFDDNAIQTFCDFPGGWGVGVSGTSSDPKAAMQVLNFAYSSKDFIDLLTFGEKDVDYTVDEEGIVTINETGYGADEYSNASWQMGNHYINSITSAQVATGQSDIWERLKEFNETALSLPQTGFWFNSSDFSSEVTAITNTYNEYADSLLMGEVDVDETLAEFNAALEANGIQSLIDEANRQYQEFLSSKTE